MAQVYILLPVYNRKDVTRRFIKCLKTQTLRDFRLVLLDDGSTDGTSDMVRGEFPHALIIRGFGAWWWGGALQVGIDALRNEGVSPESFILVVNDDTEFAPDFLQAGVSALQTRPATLLQAYCYSRQTKELLAAGIHADWSNFTFSPTLNPDESNCLSTRGTLFRFSDLKTIGEFHPVILPHYASDYEFTIRAQNRGFRLVTVPEFRLWVDETTTGIHNLSGGRFSERLKTVFSKRFPNNPVYSTVFVLLACPWRFKFLNVARIWKNTLKLLVSG